MACGCAGKAAVGIQNAVGMAVAAAGVDTPPATANRLVYRILAPGAVDPRDCVVKIDGSDGGCRNFPSLPAAMEFKADNQINGTPVGVIVVEPVGV